MTAEWQHGDVEGFAFFECPEDRLRRVKAPDFVGSTAADADAAVQRDLVGDWIPSGVLQRDDAGLFISPGD